MILDFLEHFRTSILDVRKEANSRTTWHVRILFLRSLVFAQAAALYPRHPVRLPSSHSCLTSYSFAVPPSLASFSPSSYSYSYVCSPCSINSCACESSLECDVGSQTVRNTDLVEPSYSLIWRCMLNCNGKDAFEGETHCNHL